MLTLRPFNFSQEDYAAMEAIHRASFRDSTQRAVDYKRIDDYTPQDEYDWERTMAEWNGDVVGFGLYTKTLWLSTPDLYLIGWLTHPDYRGRGIASAYWEYLQTQMLPSRTVSGLLVNARTDVPEGPAFLEKRGFDEKVRVTRLLLDLTTFDPELFRYRQQSIAQRGIEIVPLSSLIDSDPECIEKLITLDLMLRQDEPSNEPPAEYSAETFKNYYMSSDTYYPDGWFIALDGSKYVGWCAVLPNPVDSTRMTFGNTVIDRDYRRIGLATAMKVHALEHAKQQGAEAIPTGNLSTNPMLGINLTLGFKPLYDTIEFKLPL